MSKIFISHSSANNAAALAIAQWLKENGWDDYFLDTVPESGIAPGERWQEKLKTAVDQCEAMLFLISPKWCSSPWCVAEFLHANRDGKVIIGVLVEPAPRQFLPKEMTAEWQLCDLVTGTERQIFHVHTDPTLPETKISFAEAGLTWLKKGLLKARLDPTTFTWPPAKDPERAPYRGLKALEAEDAAVFFGRESAILRGLSAMRGIRDRGVEDMLVILGASGAGKSSFLRAGLWPRLKRDDHHFVVLPIIRPERAAISNPIGLAASLYAAFRERKVPKGRAEIRKALEARDGLANMVEELESVPQRGNRSQIEQPTIVIPIDQAEELFNAEGRTEADAFLSLLGCTLASPSTGEAEAVAPRRRVVAIIAIRSDSYERLQLEPKFQHVKEVPFSLRPITRDDYKMVIEGPAKRATDAGHELKIDPALTERLLQDAEGADALPLLGFTLERLFTEYGGNGSLGLDEYEALGGVRGSIEAAIKEAFCESKKDPAISEDERERLHLLRQAFIPWLAEVDPETNKAKRRVARWEEIIPVEAHPLLERLIEARLLVRDRRQLEGQSEETITVEIAHEALLRQWPTLTTWLDEDGYALKTGHAVKRAASEWVKNKRSQAWLIHLGERLEAAVNLLKRQAFYKLLGEEGRDYLTACRKKEQAAEAEREAHRKRLAEQTALVLATAAQRANEEGYYDRALRIATLAAHETGFSPILPDVEIQIRRAAHSSPLLTQLTGHKGTVFSAVFSRDGTRVATAAEDKTARVWDSKTGKELICLPEHENQVRSVVFSPDGQRLLTTTSDEITRVWDLSTGQKIVLPGPPFLLHSDPAFSRDGQRILTVSSENRDPCICDAKSGAVLTRFKGHDGAIGYVAFSQDEQRIVTASDDRTARVWDATTGAELAKLTGHEFPIKSALFSPDGLRIITSSNDRSARVWDATTGEEIARLIGHESVVFFALFSPDGKRVVTASDDKTARLWDATNGRELAVMQHEDPVLKADFSPGGMRVVTVSLDAKVRVWDATNGQELEKWLGHEDRVWCAAYSLDGYRIVTASKDMTARIWDARIGRGVVTLRGHEDRVESAIFKPDGQHIVTKSWDKSARVWDARSGEELLREEYSIGDTATSVVFSDDQQRAIFSTSQGKTAAIWDVRTDPSMARQIRHDGEVTSAAFSRDGQYVVTASHDKTGRIWDTRTGKLLTTLVGHDDVLRSAVFSPDGERVVTASDDKTARIWDVRSGQEIIRLIGHTNQVTSAIFSPDGSRILTVSNKSARIWDVMAGKELAQLAGHTYHVRSAIFSSSGRHVLTASQDKTARIWDAMTGKELARLAGHKDWVLSGVFSPDERYVATASCDNTARVWDVRWCVQHQGRELVETVCREKLLGACTLTEADVAASPLLRGREGEDVCAPSSLLTDIASVVGAKMQRD